MFISFLLSYNWRMEPAEEFLSRAQLLSSARGGALVVQDESHQPMVVASTLPSLPDLSHLPSQFESLSLGSPPWAELVLSSPQSDIALHPEFILAQAELRVRLLELEIKNNNLRLERYADVLHAVASGDASRQSILETLKELSIANSIYLFEPFKDYLRPTAFVNARLSSSLRIGLDSGLGEGFKAGIVKILKSPSASSLGLPGKSVFDNVLLQPVLRDHSCVGLLMIVYSSSIAPGNSLDIISTLADSLALIMEREDHLLQLAHLARTDALTGLPNRRVFSERLKEAFYWAKRSRTPLSLALLDIDHFKAFNDRFGHPAGDDLLKLCANNWSSALRATDLLARYGGEEFALLLPSSDLENSREVLSRVQFFTPSSQTFSAGLALWEEGEDEEMLLARVDNALYKAKSAGRNCIVVAPLQAENNSGQA